MARAACPNVADGTVIVGPTLVSMAPMTMVCFTVGTGKNSALPAWVTEMTQVPRSEKDTDGRAILQCIETNDAEFERQKSRTGFIRLFPGGGLPSITSTTTALSRAADLRVIDVENLGPHYVRTLNM